jgi:hypothetical protein
MLSGQRIREYNKPKENLNNSQTHIGESNEWGIIFELWFINYHGTSACQRSGKDVIEAMTRVQSFGICVAHSSSQDHRWAMGVWASNSDPGLDLKTVCIRVRKFSHTMGMCPSFPGNKIHASTSCNFTKNAIFLIWTLNVRALLRV